MRKRLGLRPGSLVVILILLGCECVYAAPEKAEYVPGEVLIKYKRSTTSEAIRKLRQSVQATRIQKFAFINVQHYKLKRGLSVKKTIAQLKKSPDVLYAEPNYIYHPTKIPNDPDFSKLWGLNNTGQTSGIPDADIDATEVWDIETGSSNVIVAVIDTGVDYNHPDLRDNIWVNEQELNGTPNVDDDGNGYVDDIHGYDFGKNKPDPLPDSCQLCPHGTHVAGTIAATGNNGIGSCGVSWHSKIMAVKISGRFLYPYEAYMADSDIISGIEYVTKMKKSYGVNVKISNNSYGGPDYSISTYNAIKRNQEAGALFIAAAMNDSTNNEIKHAYPSDFDLPNIISVAAVDASDKLASFSNYGQLSVDLGAPGVGIYSTIPGNKYASYNGTSMASPHVAGAAALIWSKYPDWTADQIKKELLDSVVPIPALAGKTVTGGRLNIANALGKENDSTPPSAITDLAIEGTQGNITLGWTATGDNGKAGTATSYDIRYSKNPIPDQNWEQATKVTNPPTPQSSGLHESFKITGLTPNTTYYFRLKVLDNMSNSSPLSNEAWGQYVSTAPTGLNENFENGVPPGWQITRNDGLEGPALWHLSNKPNSSNTSQSFYYGIDPQKNYDTKKAHSGRLVSPKILVSQSSEPTLEFRYFLQREPPDWGTYYDKARVLILNSGIEKEVKFLDNTEGQWKEISIDLSGYLNQEIQITFEFSADSTSNYYEGWYVDDVTIENDTTSPSAVTDLAIEGTQDEITLGWTATGDDDNSGTASSYDIRYSKNPITDQNWDQATKVTSPPTPKSAGQHESFTISDLVPNTTYYFRLNVIDNKGNTSPLSNEVSGQYASTVLTSLDEDFESGSAGWKISGSDGIGGKSLWHLSNKPDSSNTSQSFYYGIDPAKNYNTWKSHTGRITSPKIFVAPSSTPTLEFRHYLIIGADLARVIISDGSSEKIVFSSYSTFYWEKKSIDLSKYMNSEIQIIFEFSANGSYDNLYEGWYIDDVTFAVDKISPAKITDLKIYSLTQSSINLSWTAPGDDETTGQAAAYDIRYSKTPIVTTQDFENATAAANPPTPQVAGSDETFTIEGLNVLTKNYSIAMRARDEAGNLSEISNIVEAATLDSDGDGLSDKDELFPPNPTTPPTNPFASDSDGDGISDFLEVSAGTNPLERSNWAPYLFMDDFENPSDPKRWSKRDLSESGNNTSDTISNGTYNLVSVNSNGIAYFAPSTLLDRIDRWGKGPLSNIAVSYDVKFTNGAQLGGIWARDNGNSPSRLHIDVNSYDWNDNYRAPVKPGLSANNSHHILVTLNDSSEIYVDGKNIGYYIQTDKKIPPAEPRGFGIFSNDSQGITQYDNFTVWPNPIPKFKESFDGAWGPWTTFSNNLKIHWEFEDGTLAALPLEGADSFLPSYFLHGLIDAGGEDKISGKGRGLLLRFKVFIAQGTTFAGLVYRGALLDLRPNVKWRGGVSTNPGITPDMWHEVVLSVRSEVRQGDNGAYLDTISNLYVDGDTLIEKEAVNNLPYFSEDFKRVGFVFSDTQGSMLLDDVEIHTVDIKTNGDVQEGNLPPVLFSPGTITAPPGATRDIQLKAIDPDNNYLTYEVVDTSEGLDLKEIETGKFRWKTTPQDAGKKFDVTFRVSDGAMSDEINVQLSVTQAIPSSFLVFQDNFNAGKFRKLAVKKPLPKWTELDPRNNIQWELAKDGKEKVLKSMVTGKAFSPAQFLSNIPTLDGATDIVLECKVKFVSGTSGGIVYRGAVLDANPTRVGWIDDYPSFDTSKKLPKKRWYKMTLWIHQDTNLSDLYIDGQPIFTDEPIEKSFKGTSVGIVSASLKGQIVLFDDVQVYQLDFE